MHVIRYDLSMILHRSKNWKMKDGEMDLFAQLLLESRIGAYLEWLDDELIMTANNNINKYSLLVLLSAKRESSKP